MATGLINNKYRVTRRIGGGSFGEIYMGAGPNNEKVAVKFERVGTRCPQLRHEYKVYRELLNCHGFCSVYYFGTQDNYNVMVMDLLGPSLEDLFNKCARRFSLKTVLQLADQMLERVDTLHSRHLIHRDIKPANFVVGIGDQGSAIFCVDFGLSKRYRHPKSLQHIPHRDGRSLTGTPRYASINNHLGIEQSRRDDLESIGYVLIYFLKGSLPWQGLKAKNAQKKYRLILEKKQQVSIAQLCQGCPSQFAEFLAYTRSLKFDAKPDIPYLRKLFRDLYHAQGCASVGKMWDWDAIDADYFMTNSGGGSAGGPPMGPPPTGPSGQRPTTSGAMMGGDGMMMGGDDDDYDNSNRKSSGGMDGGRPSTSGAILANTGGGILSGRNSNGAPQPSAAQQWGFSRQGVASAGQALPSSVGIAGMQKDPRAATQPNAANVEYGPDGQARRPHTAHGLRAPPGPGEPLGAIGSAGVDPRKMGSAANAVAARDMEAEEDGDAHVVAGARAMMRYRRTRTSSLDGPVLPQQAPGAPAAAPHPTHILGQGQAQKSSQGWAGGADPRAYGATGPTAMVAQQQGAYAPSLQQNRGVSAGAKPSAVSSGAGAGTSWMMSDRPKSAGVGVAMGAASGAAAAPVSGFTRSNSGVGGTLGSAGGGSSHGGSNALSYGALKSRFMTGTGTRSTSATGTAGAPKATGATSSAGAAKSTSKLFTLSR